MSVSRFSKLEFFWALGESCCPTTNRYRFLLIVFPRVTLQCEMLKDWSTVAGPAINETTAPCLCLLSQLQPQPKFLTHPSPQSLDRIYSSRYSNQPPQSKSLTNNHRPPHQSFPLSHIFQSKMSDIVFTLVIVDTVFLVVSLLGILWLQHRHPSEDSKCYC